LASKGAVIVILIALTAVVAAQTADEAVVISSDFVVEGRVVKGVPYSANAITSVNQTLPTGSQIKTEMTALVARDAEGRTRREQTIRAIGPWAVLSPGEREPGTGTTVIVIQDPIKQFNYILDPRTHIARVQRAEFLAVARNREQELRNRELAGRNEEHPERAEPLGWKRIENVLTQGKRTVTILAAGRVGNNAPIEIAVETWYAPELQVVVLGRRNDPRVGDIIYRLVNIKRVDPPASLFEVPSEYRLDGPPRERPSNEGEKRK
jgi:hypothetical protein